MSKKIITASIILALILAAGFGVYYVFNRQPRITNQKIKIIEVPPEEAKNYIKLIYESKGRETASKALYNIDKLDGKLDKPHIVVKYPKIEEIFHMASKMKVAKELELTFIDRNDKILKKVKYVNTPYMGKMNVWFSKNRKIAIVFQMREDGAYWYAYDQEGDLLWKQEGTGTEDVIYPHLISPDGKYVVITDDRPMEYPSPGEIMNFFPGDISKEAGSQVAIFDKHLKTIKIHKIEGYERFGNPHFSPSGDYFAVIGYRKDEAKNNLFVFDREGKLISKFRIGKWNVEGISDDGYVFVGYMAPKTFVYSFEGERVWSENKGMALITDGTKFYYQYTLSNHKEKIINAITRKEILFIDSEMSEYRLANIYSPYVYSNRKPILFLLKAAKLDQEGRVVEDFGDTYLLIKGDEGLLIRYKYIFPEDVREPSFYIFNNKFWPNSSLLSRSGNELNDPIEESLPWRYSCAEVVMNE